MPRGELPHYGELPHTRRKACRRDTALRRKHHNRVALSHIKHARQLRTERNTEAAWLQGVQSARKELARKIGYRVFQRRVHTSELYPLDGLTTRQHALRSNEWRSGLHRRILGGLVGDSFPRGQHVFMRSEERRVGNESSCRWSTDATE